MIFSGNGARRAHRETRGSNLPADHLAQPGAELGRRRTEQNSDHRVCGRDRSRIRWDRRQGDWNAVSFVNKNLLIFYYVDFLTGFLLTWKRDWLRSSPLRRPTTPTSPIWLPAWATRPRDSGGAPSRIWILLSSWCMLNREVKIVLDFCTKFLLQSTNFENWYKIWSKFKKIVPVN